MDFQNRVGSKVGAGGVASASESNRDRRERLRLLAMETIDMAKDPYFMRNHLGSYECKLCLTLHTNEGSYLAHTQGKKHQDNLFAKRRAAKEAADASRNGGAIITPDLTAVAMPAQFIKKFIKIGRPGYKVTKQRDDVTGMYSLLFQIDFPEIADNVKPLYRLMSAYEQHYEPPDRSWQYVVVAAQPYETISFKVPSFEVDKIEGRHWTLWNKDTRQYFIHLQFKSNIQAPSQPFALGTAQPPPRAPPRPPAM